MGAAATTAAAATRRATCCIQGESLDNGKDSRRLRKRQARDGFRCLRRAAPALVHLAVEAAVLLKEASCHVIACVCDREWRQQVLQLLIAVSRDRQQLGSRQ